jgi:DNA-binding GntR family transcriptional regulator
MLDIGDMTEFTVTDQVFHRLMYEAASVPDLWNLVRRLSADLDRLRRLHLPISGKANAILDDHIAIVDAISKGDPLAAQVYLRKHLSGTLSNVDEIRKRFPMYIKG